MKYKTTIQIVTEAQDRNEAVELVEDYLSGNLSSGIDMKCRTKPQNGAAKIAVSVVICLAIIASAALSVNLAGLRSGMTTSAATSAVQPTLKTSIERKNDVFKKEWDKKRDQQVLEYIKK